MNEEFINDLILRLQPVVSANLLVEIKKEVCIVVNDYEVQRKQTGVVAWQKELPKCYEAFLVTKMIEGAAKGTLKNYANYIKDMLLMIDKPVEKITANEIRAYLYKTQEIRHLSNRTTNNRRSALNSFFSWISAEGYISCNPMLTVKPIKYPKKEREPLTPLEFEQYRAACETTREKAMVEVFYSTMCRVSELVNLNRSDINPKRVEVTLFGKGSKYRTSYLSAKAMVNLNNYLCSREDNNDALFVSEKKPYNRLSVAGIEKIIKKIGKRAGIDNVFPHRIRHTSATDALAHGMDVTQLKQILGHESLDTTMIYAKVQNDDIRNSHRKCIA